MFKPTRGPQKPTLRPSGINHFSLIKFLEQAEARLIQEGELDSAFRIEMIKEYFRQDYNPGKPLEFKGSVLGY